MRIARIVKMVSFAFLAFSQFTKQSIIFRVFLSVSADYEGGRVGAV